MYHLINVFMKFERTENNDNGRVSSGPQLSTSESLAVNMMQQSEQRGMIAVEKATEV